MSKGEEITYSNRAEDDYNTAFVFHSTTIQFKKHKRIRSQGQYLKLTLSQMDFLSLRQQIQALFSQCFLS